MKSKMPDCCAAANCKQSTDQSNVSFFRFPQDPVRCKQWVGKCHRPDLETKTPEDLHSNYRLCSKHFETSMICQQSSQKSVLKDDAVPTIFDFATNQDNAQTSNRKRTREKTGEEPVATKKTKGTTNNSNPSVPEAEDKVESDSAENSEKHNPPAHDESEEDPAFSKAKEILKDYFKETLAFTGFSITNSASLNAVKPLGNDPARPLSVNTICAEKIDQKEVLTLGEDVMREEIRNSLRLARFFSILLQDRVSIEGKDQIPVFIRSVTGEGFPQKHLMGFLPCDVDSDTLFLMLISEIRNKWGLRMEHCRGFTYLSSGAMCQKLKELSCRMLRDFPQVVLSPSEPYAFNVWLIRSMPILPIQDVVDTVEQVAAVIRQSETLAKKLDAKITASYSHIKGEVDRVKESCQNQWEYATDAFQTMLDILEPLLSSIGEMCTSALSDVDTDTIVVLLMLKEKLKNFDFIITLVVLKNTLCCVSILNPSLRGIISISSTLQYTISNALKLLTKHMQEIAIFHRKWFSDAVGRAKKLGVPVSLPVEMVTNGDGAEKPQASLEDYYREALSKKVLQYLVDEVKRVLGTEMARILRWLSLVPSYMADHNFSIRKDKVADANLNNLARPDSFYDELGCWEVKWRHASKRRILPTSVFATLKIPDIGFYPNVQSLLRVLGTIPCVRAESDVYGHYDMVLGRYQSYMKEVQVEKRLSNMAFVYVNQDVHFSIEEMVEAYVKKYPEILQLLHEDDVMEVQPSVPETSANDASKEDTEEPREMTLNMDIERQKPPECAETDKEALKSALQTAVTAAYGRQSRHTQGDQDQEVEYVTKSEMNEVLKVCEDVVRERILSELGNSFFSLFIDRVVRLGETDYLPMFIRFVDSFDVMRLELLGFIEVTHDTEAMCERLFDVVIKEWNLDLSYCRGQAYLGSGEVSYKLKAFACKIQEQYPLAICTHCSCYSFNTWWSRSVPVAAVIRAIDTLEEIVSFFHGMPALEKQLDQVLAIGLRESYEKIHELQGKFCSSWLEKHDSYEVFAQILEPLVDWLENIDNCQPQRWSLAVSNRAKRLLQLIRDFDFIVAIVALKNASSFTRELSAALQKDHFSAASQLSQISGIVATLNRVKTNIKVFHQNWFDEASCFAQSLGVQVKVPDSVIVPRDSLLKPGSYYKDTMSVPLVDHLINMVKDYFSDDHKEALNLLSLVPCSVTMSYVFETLKSKPPLYIGDLPDPDNFFTELSCWKVKWKTKVVSVTIPETIFQTLRLPLMQYFVNINTLLKIMCVLPSTALEYCGEVKRHKMYQDYLSNTPPMDRSPCLAVLQVGTDFNRDLDRMVAQCLKLTPKTLEGICLDKESKTLGRTVEIKTEDDTHMDEVEDREAQQDKDSRILVVNSEITGSEAEIYKEGAESIETQQQSENIEVVAGCAEVAAEEQREKVEEAEQVPDENGHSVEPADNIKNCEEVFKQAAMLARRNCSLIDLDKPEQDAVVQKLALCHWVKEEGTSFSEGEMLQSIVKAIRETILTEVQDSPFFSIITDRAISVGEAKFLPVFVRYVNDCIPKVELIGFLPFDESSDVDLQAKALSATLEDEWGLQMGCCRGQSIMCFGTGSKSLRKMALGFLESYPLAVNTPSESCGLAYWLALSLQNASITKVLETAEDLLQFFDQSPKLESELAKTMDGLLNTPREALAEVPETCLSRWKKREDFFDILVDMLEGVLNCLDSVSTNSSGSWSDSMSLHSQILSTALRQVDFIIPLVILKNACAPLRNCSTVFRCGNPADIICELEKIMPIIDTFSKMLDNVSAVHSVWFEEAVELATKVMGLLSYAESVSGYDSPETSYMEAVSLPVLNGLIEEMKFNFSENHLKALKVLSLLPTCNPLPILPESTEKLHTIYLSDLPEPETAEENINTWAMLAAVLPSISMECDLMKTTLNSLRTLLRDGIFNRGSKTDAVMLLMHRQTLQSLEEVIEKCMAGDPESNKFLAQVKSRVNHLRMEGEVIAMAPQEMVVDTNDSDYPQEANVCGIDAKPAAPEEILVETNDSSEIERAEENTPDQPSSLTVSSSDKATTAAQVIPACSSLPTSTPDQPTESVQDAAMQSTAAEHDRSDQLIALVQDLNDRSEVLDQCGIGLPVTGDQIVTNQGGTEQSNEEEPVSTVQSVSANQSEADQPMEVDQFVATEPGETDQPATEELSVPDQFTAVAQVDTDSTIVAQDEGCHTVTGLADGQFVSEDQSESVQLMSVDHSVNDKLESVLQSETDQPMEIDVSGNDPYVVEDQGGNGQPETGEQCVVEQLEDSPVETDQSIVKVQDEACQLLTVMSGEGETGQLVSVEQIGSHDLEAVDNSGNDCSVAAGQDKTGQSVTEDQIVKDRFLSDGQFETVNLVVKSQDSVQTEHELANEGELISEDQSESHELMVVDSGKDQSLTSAHIVTGQSEMGDQSVTEEFLVVGQVENDHSIEEDQDETQTTETEFPSEGETSQLVSGDQNVSDQLMVVDSGNDQSVTADHSVTGQSEIGDPSVTEQFIVIGQVENDHSVVEDQDKTGQTETGFPSEGETSQLVSGDQNVSDQLMVDDDSGNDQSVTPDQSVTGQSEIGDPSVTEQFIVVGQVENDHSIVEDQDNTGQTETGFPSEGETSQLVLGDQNVSDQLMVDDDSGNDPSVTADQDVTCQSVTEDQSVPDQFIAVGQVESDQSVVEGKNETAPKETILPNKVGTSQLILEDQCGADQLMVVDSGNEESVTVDHSGTGQSVLPNEVGTNQLVLGDRGSDELMVVESGNDQSVTVEQGGTDQSSPDQTVTDTFVEVAAYQPIVEHQSGFGLEDGSGTCQMASGNQSGNDQLAADESCGNDQSVVESQGETVLAVALNQSVPDQSVELSQGGNDQIVPGNPSETDQSNIDQVGLQQPKEATDCGTDQFSSVAPDCSEQETATVHICLDQSSAITPSVTDHCTPDSPEDITDHPMAAESEGTVQSGVKAQDSANQVVTLDGTGLQKIVFTPYDAVAREELLKELCNIKFFSIVTEGEFTIDGQPYISVGIHYLNKQDIKCENMLAFIPLSTNITSFIDTFTIALSEKWGLNLALCRSQTLARPGASVSQMTQASALLSQRLPHAFIFPNLLTPKSLLASLSSLREISHSFEFLEQLFMWFSEDIQRRVRLEDAVVHLFQEDERKASELKAKISSNQLAMSHEVLELTTDILEPIVFCLNEMKGNQDNEANTAQALSFLSAIQNFDFILTVVIMKNILSLTKSISLSLQGNSYDVYQAVNRVSDLLPSLSEMKNSIDSHHQTWFQEAVALASKQVPSLQPPLNVHYREDISKGAIEHCIAEMEGLSQDVLSAVRCLQVVPYVMSKVEGCCNDSELFKVFQDVLPDPNSFQDELQRWRDRWQDCIASHQHLPDTVLGTLKTSDIESFPNISTILRLLAVLPISSTQSSFTQGKMKSELYPL
uniref:THAP-type domain-containing protein n=1 Tax=Cyprinus carpio carpio TaxID=630221 RepID=A0A9J7XEJ3_CYPCA